MMKDFYRTYPQVALCGLNCLLCPMNIGGWCPGCGGEREIRAVPVPGVPGSEISVISVTAVNNTPVNSMRGWGL